MPRRDAYEEPTEYRGYTNPNVQSRSFKILQESLSYSEAHEEGIVLPSGNNPGETIVLKAYNEGKRRLEELAEINPRNFTPAGKSPYRNREPHERIEAMDEEMRLQEAMRRREQIPEPIMATSKRFETSPDRKPRAQVEIAGSSVLSPTKQQQQYLQHSRDYYQRQSPNPESRPEPQPTRPQVSIVHQSKPDQRTLFNVNYKFDEQNAIRQSSQGQVVQSNNRQKAVVTPQKSNDFIPRTQMVSSVAADLDLKLQEKPDRMIHPPKAQSPPVKVVQTQPAPEKVSVNGRVITVEAPPPSTLDVDSAKLQPGPTVKTPPMTPPPTQIAAQEETAQAPAEVKTAAETNSEETVSVESSQTVEVVQVEETPEVETVSEAVIVVEEVEQDATDGAVVAQIELDLSPADVAVEEVTESSEQVSIPTEVSVAQPKPTDVSSEQVTEVAQQSEPMAPSEIKPEQTTESVEVVAKDEPAPTAADEPEHVQAVVVSESATVVESSATESIVLPEANEVTDSSTLVIETSESVEIAIDSSEQQNVQDQVSINLQEDEVTVAVNDTVEVDVSGADSNTEAAISLDLSEAVEDQTDSAAVTLSLDEEPESTAAKQQRNQSPVKQPSPEKRISPEKRVSPVKQMSPEKKVSPEKKMQEKEKSASPVKQPSPVKQMSPEKKVSPEKSASPEKKVQEIEKSASPVKQPSPEKKVTQEKEKSASPVKQPSPEKKVAQEKEKSASPVKQPSPEKKVTQEKEKSASPVKQPSPEKKVAQEKEKSASPVKQLSPEKKVQGDNSSEKQDDRPAKVRIVDSQGGVAARLAKFKQK